MKKTRKNVFETNSSSTHSICIAKTQDYTFPEKLHLELGQFGWEESTLDTISEKASYLFTGIVNYFPNYLEELISTLESKGIEVSSDKIPGEWGDSYIDHGSELNEFVKDVMNSNEKLFSFLFSDLSFVLTGNDNSDSDVDINVSYEYDEYEKGN